MLKMTSRQGREIYHLIRGGWDDPNCARPTRGVCDRALREQGDCPSHPAPFFSILLRIEDCRMDRVADQLFAAFQALEFHEKVEPGDLAS